MMKPLAEPTRRYHPRMLEQPLLEASAVFPVVLVQGPRQVGKTTLLDTLRELEDPEVERRYVTLADFAARDLAIENPTLFLQDHPPPVLIDEIQAAPHLMAAIREWVDARGRPGEFWLVASRRVEAIDRVLETMTGRIAVVELLGLSLRELAGHRLDVPPLLPVAEVLAPRSEEADDWSLDRVFEHLWRGSFPLLHSGSLADRDRFYRSYVDSFLRRDIRRLDTVNDLSAFRRFLTACAAQTGRVLDLADLARRVDIPVAIAEHWLAALEATFQVRRLPAYVNGTSPESADAPKLYFLDTGLAVHLAGWSSPEELAESAMAQRVFETFVFGEIWRSFCHRRKTPRMSYFRAADGHEVQFLLEHDGRVYPLAVELETTPRTTWARVFTALDGLGHALGEGGVVCLASEQMPLDERTVALPVGLL
ncbi:MAG: ATP-binding protein [Acidobacteriota bacterium]